MRRRIWILVALPAAVAALAAGIFFASLSRERSLRRLEGVDPRLAAPPAVPDPLRGPNAVRNLNPRPADTDPRVQDTLRTIQEIERINRLNEQLRQNRSGQQPPPKPNPTKPRDNHP